MPTTKTPLWADSAPVRFPALQSDLTVDVAVVGGGITGVTAARLLVERGVSVALLEARRVGSGETKHTTAHLTEVLDARLRTLVADFGEDGARLAVRGQRVATEQIGAFVSSLSIDCQFERLPGYLIAETAHEARELDHEAAIATRLGLDTHLVDETPLPFPVIRALRFDRQAQLHPGAYLRGLVASLGEGCHIFEKTAVTEVVDGLPCRVMTKRGTITAKHVVVATNVPISTRYLLHPKLAAYRSYAMALALPGTAPTGLFWDMKDPYHYIRGQVVDGTSYLIVGGEDHKVGTEADPAQAFERLDGYLLSRFGRTSAPTDFRWSGQIIEPADGLPYVGRSALSSHVLVATGYSGNGITSGTLGAMILCDQIAGVDNAWSGLLAATRVKPLASARAVLSENVDFPKHLVGDRLGLVSIARKGDVAAIAPGEGAIVSLAGEKLAVYRNHEGDLSALSPVCTHLGCYVQFNSAEKSWDCPCHGSRFDTTGRVLNGPATAPLAALPFPSPSAASKSPRLSTRVGRGAAAGVAATGVMSAFMWLMQRAGTLGKAPPRKITERSLAASRRWPARKHRLVLTAAAHLAFGAGAGALFALASASLPRRRYRVAAGAAWGIAIWRAMYGHVLPAAGLMPELRSDRPLRPTTMAAAHIVYGVALGAIT